MVQKSAPTKFPIHAKQENASFSSYPEGKNRGETRTDLKKRMKISSSKSTKNSDIRALRSSPLRGKVPRTGLLPILQRDGVADIDHTTPRKQSGVKHSNGSSPNYMKPTSSSISRKQMARVSGTIMEFPKPGAESESGRKRPMALSRTSGLKRVVSTLTKAPSFKHPGTKCSPTKCSRATCSSTMKDARFPAYLVLDPDCEVMSALKVCPYTYCSLSGHHGLSSSLLRRMVAVKRKLLKTLKSVKPGEEKPVFKEEDFFVEIYAATKQEGNANRIEYDGVATSEQESQTPYSGFEVRSVHKEGSVNKDKNEAGDSMHYCDVTEEPISMPDEEALESSLLATHEVDLNGNFNIKSNQIASETSNLLIKGCQSPNTEGGEETRKINLRGPNFFPLEADLEVEKVDLRHQMMAESKNAEEWMLDYALQQAVTNLAVAQKRRVALLVEAFETVSPISDSETNTMHAPPLQPIAHWPIQACN